MFVSLSGTIKYCFLVEIPGIKNGSLYCGMEIHIFCAFFAAVGFGTRMLSKTGKINRITLYFKFCGP